MLCIKLTECKWAQELLSHENVKPQLCGFIGNDTEVCCPATNTDMLFKRPGDRARDGKWPFLISTIKLYQILACSKLRTQIFQYSRRRRSGIDDVLTIVGGQLALPKELKHMVIVLFMSYHKNSN